MPRVHRITSSRKSVKDTSGRLLSLACQRLFVAIQNEAASAARVVLRKPQFSLNSLDSRFLIKLLAQLGLTTAAAVVAVNIFDSPPGGKKTVMPKAFAGIYATLGLTDTGSVTVLRKIAVARDFVSAGCARCNWDVSDAFGPIINHQLSIKND